MSARIPLDVVVTVDPVKYYEMNYKDKYKVSAAIHAVNWKYRDQDKHMMLMAPGRIGTSSPELGVPTTFADISAFEVLCEVDETQKGYRPELSYGSHFFQDLVEAGILYTAIFSNEKTITFQPELLARYENRLADFMDNCEELQDVIKVCIVSGSGLVFFHDIGSRKALCLLEKAACE